MELPEQQPMLGQHWQHKQWQLPQLLHERLLQFMPMLVTCQNETKSFMNMVSCSNLNQKRKTKTEAWGCWKRIIIRLFQDLKKSYTSTQPAKDATINNSARRVNVQAFNRLALDSFEPQKPPLNESLVQTQKATVKTQQYYYLGNNSGKV